MKDTGDGSARQEQNRKAGNRIMGCSERGHGHGWYGRQK